MTLSKAELFSEELQELANIHKALAHPARLAILNYIARSNSCITGDISEHFPIARTTINQHLAELKKVDLIKGDVCGARVKYCLNTAKISQAKLAMLDFFEAIKAEDFQNC